jgi:hypothetical protein
LPGKWWWTIKIRHPKDLLRLPSIYTKIILVCERIGVTRPQHLPIAEVDGDVRWLVLESSVRMEGHPEVPPKAEHRTRRAMITPPNTWGGLDETFSELDEALSTAFDMEHIQGHVAKLMRTEADERHLFLIVGVYDLPFSLFGAVGSGDRLPAGAPTVPDGLTHLWLAPEYGHRVLIGTRAGWAETRDIRPAIAAEDATSESR